MSNSEKFSRWMPAVELADKEFERDGGLTYSQEVLEKVESNDILFNYQMSCVTLCTLIHLLLKEYGSVMEQLRVMGVKLETY